MPSYMTSCSLALGFSTADWSSKGEQSKELQARPWGQPARRLLESLIGSRKLNASCAAPRSVPRHPDERKP